jgi:hypothetical protein
MTKREQTNINIGVVVCINMSDRERRRTEQKIDVVHTSRGTVPEISFQLLEATR